MLSNLGVVEPIDMTNATDHSMELQGIELLPPIRSKTQLSFGAVSYADKMHLTMHYDHGYISSLDARQILEDFVEELLKNIEN